MNPTDFLKAFPDFYYYNPSEVPDGSTPVTKTGYRTEYLPIPDNLTIPERNENALITIWYFHQNINYPAPNEQGNRTVTYKNETYLLDYNDKLQIEQSPEGIEIITAIQPQNAEQTDLSPLIQTLEEAEDLFDIP